MKASVIIPSYNSKERLYYNLISLNNQECDFNIFEVIVIDNGSKDNTLEMLKNFKPKFSFKLVRLEENKGIARGRNAGIKKAIGDILIFHDSDMIAPRDFIVRHLEHHKEKNVVVCGLPWRRINTFYYKELDNSDEKNMDENGIKNKDKNDKYNKAPLISEDSIINGNYMKQAYDLDSDFIRHIKEILNDHKGTLEDYNLPWRFFFTNNASVERSRVIEVGMFDENIVDYGFEDYDLGIRLYKSGSNFIFDKNILSIHQEHPTNIDKNATKKNTNYICDKYNNIYFLDVILVCIYYLTSINVDSLEKLVKDINNMLPLKCFENILNIFLKLLQTCRQRFIGENIININKIIPPVLDMDLNKLIIEVKILRYVFGIRYFTEAMLTLIRDVYNVYC